MPRSIQPQPPALQRWGSSDAGLWARWERLPLLPPGGASPDPLSSLPQLFLSQRLSAPGQGSGLGSPAEDWHGSTTSVPQPPTAPDLGPCPLPYPCSDSVEGKTAA